MQLQLLIDAAALALKAVAILALIRIAVTDFREHKVYNRQLLPLLALALGIVVLEAARAGNVIPAAGALGVSALLFALLIGFWLAGRLGAGDVKLLTIVPLLVGYAGALPMTLALLGFLVLAYLVTRFPTALPESWFRVYAQSLDSTGRIPLGVPIAAATILVMLMPRVSA